MTRQFGLALLFILGISIVIFAGQTASLTGTVVNGNSEPISGATVKIGTTPAAIMGRESDRIAKTDETGRYRFADLAPGTYFMSVEADGYVTTPGPRATIVAGKDLAQSPATMVLAGTISGRVLDENKEPVVKARIDAQIFSFRMGRRILTGIGKTAVTDDRGEFRIFGLSPDEYYIQVSPPIAFPPSRQSYPAIYYPNTTDPGQAGKVVLSAGSSASALDVTLLPGGVSIRGKVIDATNEARRPLFFLLPRSTSVVTAGDLVFSATGARGEGFDIRGIVPGSYYIYAGVPGKSQGRAAIEVSDRDVDNVSITLHSYEKLQGKVMSETGSAGTPELSSLSVSLNADDMPSNLRSFSLGRTAADGTFALEYMSEASYRIQSVQVPRGWFVSSARYGDQEVLGRGFSYSLGKPDSLEIRISNAGGGISGTVKNREGQTTAGTSVVLVPMGTLKDESLLFKGVSVRPDGSFSITGIRPGDYTLVALEKPDPRGLPVASYVQQFLQYGKPVTVRAGTTSNIDAVSAPAIKP